MKFPFDQQRPIPYRNDNAGTVAAFGVLVITGKSITDNDLILTCDKPSTTFKLPQLFAINGTGDVATGKSGELYFPTTIQVAYDTGTPAVGECWGPKPSQWTLSKNYPGNFICIGDIDNTNKVALFQFSPFESFLGKTTSGVTASTPTTAYSLWVGGTPASGSASTYVPPSATSLIDIDTGKFVKITLWPGYAQMEPLECNA